MFKFKMLAASTIAALSIMAVPAAAKDQPTTCAKAYTERQAVIKKHGKRAPGRNICRFGVRSKFNPRWSKPATFKQKVAYLNALRALNVSLPYTYAGAPRVEPAGTGSLRAGGPFAAIRSCESGGNYSTNTGNGFYGAYQFDLQTWQSVGGTGLPSDASPSEQDRRAAILYAQRGSSPWPVCGR